MCMKNKKLLLINLIAFIAFIVVIMIGMNQRGVEKEVKNEIAEQKEQNTAPVTLSPHSDKAHYDFEYLKTEGTTVPYFSLKLDSVAVEPETDEMIEEAEDEEEVTERSEERRVGRE